MESTSLQGFPATTWSRFYELDVCKRGTSYYLKQDKLEREVGVLDIVTTEILNSLHGRPQITHKAVLDASALPKLHKKKPQHVVVDISINMSGPSDKIDVVGDALTKDNGFLQHPCYLPAGTPYVNPHYYYPSGIRTDLAHLIGPPTDDTESSELSQGLESVMNNLAESD
ncbi:SNF2 family N-terminal domain-containing protein [Apiospora rasikravindrae]|uniref:SNF2 family N-terminal domain-containing protein n=1 Tax=Apiospora rasikravindrae TaxID=990691 RepID=A0ABR1S2C5_9PEZI